MSIFICPHCHQGTHVFGSQGVARACSNNGIDFLGEIPLDANICDSSDRGQPTVISEPLSGITKAFTDVAQKLAIKLDL